MTTPRRRKADTSVLSQVVNLVSTTRVVVTLVVAIAGALFAVRKALTDLEAVKSEQVKVAAHVAKADTTLLEQQQRMNDRIDPMVYLVRALARGQCHSNPSRASEAGIPCAALDLDPVR